MTIEEAIHAEIAQIIGQQAIQISTLKAQLAAMKAEQIAALKPKRESRIPPRA